MVSADPQAVSAILTAPSTATTQDHPGLATAAERPADWTSEWFVYLVPDIRDETAAEITKAKAWPAFNAVFRLLRYRARKASTAKARAAAESGVLDNVGIRGLARSIGTSSKAMSRQIAALQAIGILAAFRPPASMTRDPDTGKMVRRPAKAGRVEAARIVLTLGDDHRKPANKQGFDRPSKPPGRAKGPRVARSPLRVDPTPSRADPKGRSDTTSISPLPISLTARPPAAKAGRPAEDAARRPDGRTGGRRQAGQDRCRVGGSAVQRPPNAATEATPTPPAGTGTTPPTPAGEDTVPVRHDQRPSHRVQTEAMSPGADTSDLRRGRPAANASQADGSGMDRSLGSWLDAYRQAIGRPAAQATTADEAADRLRRSLDELPDESRQRAADLGQDLADIEDEARRLAEIVQRRQRDEDATAKAEATARSEGHRQAWHRKRAKATAAA